MYSKKTNLHKIAWNVAVGCEYVLTQGYIADTNAEGEMLQLARKLYSAETVVVSGFPGIGKTHVFNNHESGLLILDSDSSKFDKSQFPSNYMSHITDNLGAADVIFVSSHDTVRNAMVEREIPFFLIYPDISIKEEYIQRYIDRGNNSAFVSLLEKNWDTWVGQLETQTGCIRVPLKSGQYLSDVLFSNDVEN